MSNNTPKILEAFESADSRELFAALCDANPEAMDRILDDLCKRCNCDPFAPKYSAGYRINGFIICAKCKGQIS
jgi:hypothetical protein